MAPNRREEIAVILSIHSDQKSPNRVVIDFLPANSMTIFAYRLAID